MKLQLEIHNIHNIEFSEKTEIKAGTLSINHQELQNLLQQDKRLKKVDIELAKPGESCRILQVSDVIEPRIKINGDAEDFPGALGKQGTVGAGRTCVLRGPAIILSNQGDPRLLPEGEDEMGNIIDMSGPGAEFSLFAKTLNIVLLPHPAETVSFDSYRLAFKLAGLKAAVYLARAGLDLEPDKLEVVELPSLIDISKSTAALPKVAYICQVHCTSYPPITGEPILYGDNIKSLLPTIVHPNEVLDGALVNPYHNSRACQTYIFQNHPIINSLYNRHGKDLCFVGVILTVSRYTEPERERSAAMAANLAKSVLGADGAIITKASGGAPDIDAAQTAQKCEDLGVKAVLIMFDVASGIESGTVFNLPGARAIVNTGNEWELVRLPAVDRIIGRPVILPSGISSSDELNKAINWIAGALDQEGHSKIVSVRY
ncbi:glycine/sarcosine/betaine reductase component B subunit [Chloroflexota bacterium]